MSETTQILFNSPALHSLKRDQLVKLCKIHSIKASGKNVEIIQRLKHHAQTLPPSEPLSVAARSEEPTQGDGAEESGDEDVAMDQPELLRGPLPRPSEQWEIVMDDIEEESSSRGGSLNSLRTMSGQGPAGEFGTGSSKASSMSSSIKALANSFGFKRAASVKSNSSRSTATSSSMPSTVGDGEELAQYSTPYSSLPEVSPSAMPQTDHFKFSTPDTTIADHHSDSSVAEPVPGQGSRAGMPAPANARLSTGAGATTTIRLVSASSTFSRLSTGPGTPQLKVFNPAFDLILGSPGGEGEPRVPVWPLSPGGPSTERLYPALPWGDFIKTSKEEEAAIGGDDVDMPGAIAPPQITVSTPAKSSPSKSHHTPRTFPTPSNEPIDLFSPAPASLRTPKDGPSIPRSQPFIFGSPLPQHNVSNKAFGNAAATVLEEMNRRLSAVGGQKVGMELLERSQPANTDGGGSIFGDLGSLSKVDRFEKAHNAQFNKMDSILTHYAAKRAAPASKKRKSSVLGRGAAPAKKRVSAETRVISAGGRKRMGIPGGFGDEDEDEEDIDNGEESRRMSKRVRVLEGDGGMDKGKRVSIAPTEKDKKKAEKERDAVRRALDAKREKRRSSIRRVSGIAPPIKGKGSGSRFGFLSSAKSMVRTVWNMGAGTNTKAAPTGSSIPVAKPSQPKPSVDEKKAAKPSLVPSRLSAAPFSGKGVASTSRIASGSSDAAGSTSSRLLKPSAAVTSSKAGPSSRSRSPIPAFGSTSTKSGVLPSSHSRAGSINSIASAKPGSSMAPPSSTSSRLSVRPSIASGPSSMGTRGSAATRASSSGISSIGTKRSMAPPVGIPKSVSSTSDKGSMSSFGKVSSRLFAPTASSLAKTRTSLPSQAKASGSLIARAAAPKSPAASGHSALDQITNSPRAPASRKESPGKIFSKPLSAASSPSLIPSPVRPTSLTAAASTIAGLGSPTPSKPPSAIAAKPKGLAARKPRISRSRVIAKLGAQRAAAAAASSSVNPRVSESTGRTRSSIGAAAARRSYGGVKSGKARGSDVLMSAKKRARQSEYMRRRSRAAGSAVGASSFQSTGDGSADMDVDD